MTVLLRSTVIVLGPSAADSNACTGTALPINLSHRECRSFQQRWRLSAIAAHALNRRPRSQTNRLPPAAANPAPTATDHGLRPLSP